MLQKLWGRRLVLAVALVVTLLLAGASVTMAAPADQPEDWCYGYVVRHGETLSGIAYRYGVSWQALASYNGIGNPNYVRAGQCLAIPPYGYYSYYNPYYYYQPQRVWVPGHWVWVNGYWVWR